MFWQTALAVTSVLVLIRFALYLLQRSRSPQVAEESAPPGEGTDPVQAATTDAESASSDEAAR
jgi:hypothetical protein